MIELSCDLGEASTPEQQAVEDAIWPMIDAANVACGGHAGDESTMTGAVHLADRLRVTLGAHPSYPDRENFGRKSMKIEPDVLRASLVHQIDALRSIARTRGLRLERVKPHGALYNDAFRDRKLGDVIAAAVRHVDPLLAVVGTEGSQMIEAARAAGLPVIREAFADRAYRPDGSLVPRSEPDALLSVDDAAAQAERLARKEMGIPFDTICIHADMEHSAERLRAIRYRLAPLLRMTSE